VPGEENTGMKAAVVSSFIVSLLVAALVLPRAPARAQVESREGIVLQNQIAELRQELQILRDQLGRTPPPAGGSTLGGYQPPPQQQGDSGTNDLLAQLLGRVERLEDDVRTLRGRIDEVDNARQREAEEVTKQIGDLNFKIENGAGAAPPAGDAATAPPPSGTSPGPRPLAPPPPSLSPPPGTLGAKAEPPPAPPPPPPPKRTPEVILAEGNAALAKKDYPAAEAAAKTVLAAGGPRAADAQLLLARAAYGARRYPDAAIAYDDAYKRARTGPHAQDALLGLAASLAAIPQKLAACETLGKLAAEFPTVRADLRPSVATLRREAGCH
jgi:TolA-binding protein